LTLDVELEQVAGHETLASTCLTLQGELAVARGEIQEADLRFREAITQYPTDTDAWQCRCRFLFEHGEPHAARDALETLVQLRPDDGATYHNLGLAHVRLEEWDDAVKMFTKSLGVRPENQSTQDELARGIEQRDARECQ
jgi:stress-induced-phosphoprotein 1